MGRDTVSTGLASGGPAQGANIGVVAVVAFVAAKPHAHMALPP